MKKLIWSGFLTAAILISAAPAQSQTLAEAVAFLTWRSDMPNSDKVSYRIVSETPTSFLRENADGTKYRTTIEDCVVLERWAEPEKHAFDSRTKIDLKKIKRIAVGSDVSDPNNEGVRTYRFRVDIEGADGMACTSNRRRELEPQYECKTQWGFSHQFRVKASMNGDDYRSRLKGAYAHIQEKFCRGSATIAVVESHLSSAVQSTTCKSGSFNFKLNIDVSSKNIDLKLLPNGQTYNGKIETSLSSELTMTFPIEPMVRGRVTLRKNRDVFLSVPGFSGDGTCESQIQWN